MVLFGGAQNYSKDKKVIFHQFLNFGLRFFKFVIFENDLDEVQPARDETAWNEMSLYTRRDHAIKPYLRFLRTTAPVALEL